MNSQLTESLLSFMFSFAIASIVGFTSYIIIRLFVIYSEGCALYLGCLPFCVVVAFMLTSFAIINATIFLRFMALIVSCFLGTIAERATRNDDKTLFYYFIVLVSATSVSLMIGLGFFSTFEKFFPAYFEEFGYYYGLAITPSAVSYFLWIRQTLEMRPGIDKHFDD